MSAVVTAHDMGDLLEFSPWARTQYLDKYSQQDANGVQEEWPQTARRVVTHVLGALGYSDDSPECVDLIRLVEERKFIPGGRYLANTGMPYHQVNNCLAGDTRIVTKHGIVTLAEAASYLSPQVIVRNRFGEWERGEVHLFGEQEIYRVVFSNGDVVEATANHRWWQADGTRVTTLDLESVPFGVAAEVPEMSAEGVRHGIVYGDGTLPRGSGYAHWDVVNPEKDEALVSWFEDEEREVVVGGGAVCRYRTIRTTARGTKVALQPAHYKELPGRTVCDPEYARGFIAGLIATDGCVSPTGSVTIHQEGLAKARQIAEIAVLAGCVVNSVRVVSTESPFTSKARELAQISIKPFSAPIILPSHQAKLNVRQRRRMMELGVESVEATGRVEEVYCVVAPETESFTLANGLITSNCFLYRCKDSREGWADLNRKAILALSSGGGIGVVYSDIRPFGTPLKRVRGQATGPLSPAKMVNEVAREVMAGSRRSAIWGGLHWWHPDIFRWIEAKDWSPDIKALKEKNFNNPAPLDMTNISVILDDDFFTAYHDDSHPQHEHAHSVYWRTTEHMVSHGEPGFSVNVGENNGEDLRNACTEITSRDDSDVCNLGSLNLARITSAEELSLATRLGTLFLLAGTVYSDIPHEEVYETRNKNRRLGLGLMGVHEWLIKNGHKYAIVDELRPWLEIYRDESRAAADYYAEKHALSVPVKVRAIAPNGTIGIIAETTTSGEPVLFVACKRRFLENGVWRYQYVIDPTVERMRKQYGINPDEIETAYILAYDVEQRIRFQADLQEYVDHGISSTINLPYPITDPTEVAEFGNKLMGYLPRLRGITCYPEGARAGQPFTPVTYRVAASQLGVTFDEDRDRQCSGSVCGV